MEVDLNLWKPMPKLEKLDLRWVSSLPLPGWVEELEARGCLVYR